MPILPVDIRSAVPQNLFHLEVVNEDRVFEVSAIVEWKKNWIRNGFVNGVKVCRNAVNESA